MDDKTTSAPAGLAGYDYQVDVSIYLALDLMLVRKRLDEITLEPANHEDLAADLRDETQVSSATRIIIGGYPLIVQAKLRHGEPWSDTDLETLLTKGKKRKSPNTLLTEDTTLRYLLVTSAATKGVARDLRMGSVGGTWPAHLPPNIGSRLPGLDGRIAVLDGLDEAKLDGQIRDLLQTTCKVPLTHIPNCIKELRSVALKHMRNGPSVWTRDALEKTITAFGGYLTTAPEVGMFVKPTNWGELQKKLATQYGVIISGSSGTGKTTAAEVLLDELRSSPYGAFKVIRVTGGPEQVWKSKETGRVVFMIEDPWGKYRYHPEQGVWNRDLDRMLNEAHADRQFIVTTRSDVLKESGERLSGRWFVPLETQHYGQRERFRLFDNQVRLLPEVLKPPVYAYRDLILKRLESPYEIQKFFDGLADDQLPDETVPTFIDRCLGCAHIDAIENTIVDQVEDRHDTLPAIAIWGLLKALPRLSWEVVPQLADAIGASDLELEDKIVPLIRFMAAGRNLRQPNDVLSYYHPRVEAGLERIIKDHGARAARLLGVIVDVLIAIDSYDGADWGHEAAARLVQGAKNDCVRVTVSRGAQVAIDAHVRTRLLTDSDTLEFDLKLAADVGSPTDTITLFARWFSARGKTFGLLQNWRETPVSSADASRMVADLDVSIVAGRVIREMLARTNDNFPDDFADRIAVVAGVQTDAFRDAALRMVGFGYEVNAKVVGKGALTDFTGFEAVVDAAIDVSVRLRGDYDGSVWLEIRNGEHSEDYAEHLTDMHHDDGDTADSFIRLYVAELRRRSGWNTIVARPRSAELVWGWIQVLGGDGVIPQPGEMVGLADAVRGHRHDAHFWDMARNKWSADLDSRLDDYLKTPGLAEDKRYAVLKTMIVNEPAQGHAWIQAMATVEDLQGVLRAMTDLRVLVNGYELKAEIMAFAADAPDQAGPYAQLARAVLDETPYALSPIEIDRLEAFDAASPDLQVVLVRLLAGAGRPVRKYIESLLAGNEIEDIGRATTALAFAAKEGLLDIVEGALKHRFADVRRDALLAIANGLVAPLPAHILAMAHDKGSGVRRAVVEILGAKPDAAHQATLIGLTADTWTRAEIYYGEEASYPIATAAAKLLGDQAPLFADAIDTLMTQAAVTSDPDLRNALLLAVAKQGDVAGRDRLADIALEIGRPRLHGAAAEALFLSGDRSPIRAARFEKHLLSDGAPNVAVSMALVVGSTGDKTAVLTLARTLYMNPDRSALVVPLLLGAAFGEEGLMDAIAALLPDEIRTGLALAFNEDVLAPRTLLDPLGDFRLRSAVIDRLHKLFEPKPKDAQPVFKKRF
ncbi:hypothetical protein [Agrobacterium sp. NPDC090283]|uniref:nSTAND3 domain-containing NTPase n=1 Tax=Agrobacterium sp. NPDC090283 TaxID=3363920 RepID=UPI00383A503F